jgi:hypothetical protein
VPVRKVNPVPLALRVLPDLPVLLVLPVNQFQPQI